ncbi:hypothetical protein [Bradyrhizobium sp. Tv2a-2]|uniref:hypothetical protein n=1 Tax=Bradyrhizobium sp. Tv2a-2 TaxID=113395 RepID=UPI0012EC0F87|nr:hypothetical protein [Bradyrhizobium sp. Tv2a-2]
MAGQSQSTFARSKRGSPRTMLTFRPEWHRNHAQTAQRFENQLRGVRSTPVCALAGEPRTKTIKDLDDRSH